MYHRYKINAPARNQNHVGREESNAPPGRSDCTALSMLAAVPPPSEVFGAPLADATFDSLSKDGDEETVDEEEIAEPGVPTDPYPSSVEYKTGAVPFANACVGLLPAATFCPVLA